MEPTNSFDLSKAIGQYVSQVNSANILSGEEKDQLHDHFYSETASLQDSGLNAEEAFLVAKMRFGDASTIQKEFAKVKPWNNFIQTVLMAVVLVLGIKLVLNVAKMLSFLLLIALQKFSTTNIEDYLNTSDWILQVGLTTILFYFSYIICTKARVTHIKHLWPAPVLFLLSEVANRAVTVVFFDTVDTRTMTTYYIHSVYIYLGVGSIIIVASLWILYRNKDQRIRFS
ncbi:MAG: hypothetical protein WBA23_23990 [Tunicatimonas sp.]|uniref:hypothetical protein n=1 Tax=Tunicatimonas sp. TaxID=1940096 RepID=UPI003C766538